MPKIYSLSRLQNDWPPLAKADHILVGGRYKQLTEQIALLSSGADQLQIPLQSVARDGDLICVTIAAQNLTIGAERPVRASVDVVLNCELLFRPQSQILKIKNHYHMQFTKNGEATINREQKLRRHTPHEILFWSSYLQKIREFFHTQNFIEATTPSLVVNPGMEPELEPFLTEWHTGSKKKQFFLPTSPELHLKKLIVQGHSDVFEMKTVYRNEETTPIHEPEFQMLEWYRSFADLEMIQNDLFRLLNFLAEKLFHGAKDQLVIEHITVRELWQKYLGLTLSPNSKKEELINCCGQKGISVSHDLSWNDVFHLLWVTCIDPHLPRTPMIVRDYPPSLAALAKLTDEGWADRFEFYWGGYEIANAFNELTDPVEQRYRFVRDQKRRKEYGRTQLDIDEDFMQALEFGLPPSAGIALGLDRLFRIFYQSIC